MTFIHSIMMIISVFNLIMTWNTVNSFAMTTLHRYRPEMLMKQSTMNMMMFDFGLGNSKSTKIPRSTNDRDNQAISAIKAAIKSYRDIPLIECEFPPLDALNKLGDGSLRSALEVENVSVF